MTADASMVTSGQWNLITATVELACGPECVVDCSTEASGAPARKSTMPTRTEAITSVPPSRFWVEVFMRGVATEHCVQRREPAAGAVDFVSEQNQGRVRQLPSPAYFLAAAGLAVFTVFALVRFGCFADGNGPQSASLSRLPTMGGCWASTSHISRIQSEM